MLAVSFFAAAQDKIKFKFGNVNAEDFKTTVYPIDSSAAAVIIADVGSTEIVGNSKGSFSLLFKNYRRAHILNKNGYDIANIEIPLYADGDAEEQLENLKAITYNLENGKVVETKLDIKSAVFKDRLSKKLVIRKFTFPNIKEGSIIEYEYRVMSDFIFNLQPWTFQGQYPRLWSEYNVSMPEFYNYVTLTQGYHAAHIKTQKSRRESYTMSETRGTGATDRATFTAGVTDFRWVLKDIPALKVEAHTSALKNHISRIEFQLASIRDPFVPRSFMSTWVNVSKELMERENFGLPLRKDNGWLNDALDEAAKGATELEKARNIYAWVRDNILCTDHSALYLEQTLRNVMKNRRGSVAEINLLLTALLLKADIKADPVLLSTRSHGYTHEIYPLMDRFNYVITAATIGDKTYFLDASDPRMGFGHLSTQCYNGHARVINEYATPIDLNPETIKETSSTTVFIINDEKDNIVGNLQQTPGYYQSYAVRDNIMEKGKDAHWKDVQKTIGTEIEISNMKIDSLDKYDEPVTISFDFKLNSEKEDIIYFNPMFGEGVKENPFVSAQRFYPVEMSFASDQIYNLQMEVPKGYVVDELPKQTIVKFNEEGDAQFEYRISESGGRISLRSRLVIKRTWFAPDEYEILREFFNLIVKKHNEQIVFKKKG
jgi:hypothetical protein